MKQVKTAVVGCGMISNIYIKNLQNLFSVIDLVGLCNRSPRAAEEKSAFFGIPVMTLDEIKADPSIELVVNLTGPTEHYAVVRDLLLAGKNVYTEKMLCLELEQGKELVRLADERGLYLGVAPDTFLGAGLQSARTYIDRGLIGRVTSVRAAINRSQALNSELFGYIRRPGGGFAYDIGVYYMTALLSLFGPVKRLAAFASERETHEAQLFYTGRGGERWPMADRNLYTAALQFDNGVLGTVHFDGESIDEEQPAFVVYGTEGILRLGDPVCFNGKVHLMRNNTPELELPFTHGYTGSPLYGKPTPADYGQHRGVGVAELAWAMLASRPNRASKELGLHTLELLLGMDAAAEKGLVYEMTTTFARPAPLPTGYTDLIMGGVQGGAEMALVH